MACGTIDRRGFSGLLLGAALLALPQPGSAAAPLQVVATTGMIGDLVRSIAGEAASVTQLMGAGVDPHLYKPTRTDIVRLTRADLVLYNGLLLEGKMTDALERVAAAGRPVFAVAETVDESLLLAPALFQGQHDPHLWMDPRAWSKVALVVRDRLAALDSAGAETYAANAERLLDRLQALDAYAEGVLASVPPPRRVLVTAHDAFGYFGRRYGFEVEGIQGLSTESEAGVRRIEDLVGLLVERAIPAVFVETTVPGRTVEALIAGAAARGHEVRIGGSLYSDAMGAPGTYEGTYIGMIDHNVTTIARALGGSVPERGLNGLLASAG